MAQFTCTCHSDKPRKQAFPVYFENRTIPPECAGSSTFQNSSVVEEESNFGSLKLNLVCISFESAKIEARFSRAVIGFAPRFTSTRSAPSSEDHFRRNKGSRPSASAF